MVSTANLALVYDYYWREADLLIIQVNVYFQHTATEPSPITTSTLPSHGDALVRRACGPMDRTGPNRPVALDSNGFW